MKIVQVNADNIHTILPKYIKDNDIKITDIDSMIETYMNMVKENFLFTLDRDLLKDILVDLTYMYAPNDDSNKDRVLCSFWGSDSDDDDEDSECDDSFLPSKED